MPDLCVFLKGECGWTRKTKLPANMRPNHGAEQLLGASPHDGVTGGCCCTMYPLRLEWQTLGYLELSALERACRMTLVLYRWLTWATNEAQSSSGADVPLWHLYWQTDSFEILFIFYCDAGRIKIFVLKDSCRYQWKYGQMCGMRDDLFILIPATSAVVHSRARNMYSVLAPEAIALWDYQDKND